MSLSFLVNFLDNLYGMFLKLCGCKHIVFYANQFVQYSSKRFGCNAADKFWLSNNQKIIILHINNWGCISMIYIFFSRTDLTNNFKAEKIKSQVKKLDTCVHATVSMKLAALMSRLLSPFTSCDESVICTLLYTLNHSGWWSTFSEYKAMRVIKPNACKNVYDSIRAVKPQIPLTHWIPD